MSFKSLFLVTLTSLLFFGILPNQSQVYATPSYECDRKMIRDAAGGLVEDLSNPLGSDIDPDSHPACTSIDTGAMGFRIPSLGDILTFAIRAFFVIAGLAALFYLLLGAFGWITSGGDKDSIGAARDKIQAAVLGMILIVAVLAIIWTLEQVIFNRRICLGLSCPLTLPGLLTTTTGEMCCSCLSSTGRLCGGLTSTDADYGSCEVAGTLQPVMNLFDMSTIKCAR